MENFHEHLAPTYSNPNEAPVYALHIVLRSFKTSYHTLSTGSIKAPDFLSKP